MIISIADLQPNAWRQQKLAGGWRIDSIHASLKKHLYEASRYSTPPNTTLTSRASERSLNEIMETPPIRVLIADDYYAFRQALKIMLSFEPDIDVIAEASNGRQTLELAGELNPSAIVMDLSMGRLSGVELVKKLLTEHPSVHILIVSGEADQRVIDELLECGAKGYISKSRSLRDVPVALRRIIKGKNFVGLAQANRSSDRSF